jgi:Asp-tRNA(Asn)/Glu-tRNA(Gln) amidotransferase C subunit
MKIKWCEVFKAGTHTDSNGNTKEWTTEDLDNIVTKFGEQDFAAPVVIGHPETNSPAYGWIDSLKREGDKLLASFKDVVPEFTEAVNRRIFKNRSISLYPDFRVRHIGFLGGMQPAIKGLEDFQFSEDNTAALYEFSDYSDIYQWKFENIGDMFQSIREFFIEKYDIDTADRLFSAWRLDEIKKAVNVEDIKNYAESFTQVAQKSEFSETESPQNKELEKLREELDFERAQNRKKDFEQYAESLASNGNILPHQKSLVIDLMECTYKAGTFDFSEGEEKSVLERFKTILNSVKQVEFSEIANQKNTGATKTPIEFSDGKEAAEAIKRVQKESIENDGVELDPVSALKKAKGA